MKVDWPKKCNDLGVVDLKTPTTIKKIKWDDLIQMVIFPVSNESYEIIEPSFKAIKDSGYPLEKMIVVLTVEERGGDEVLRNANRVKDEYGELFKDFILTVHPDGLTDEMKGKGANQAWAAKIIQDKLQK